MSDKELQDLKDLLDKGLISQEAYDDALSKLEAANTKSEVEQLKEELEKLKKRKEKLIEEQNKTDVSESEIETSTASQKEAVPKNTIKNFLISNKLIIGLLAVGVAAFYIQNSNPEGSSTSGEVENPEGIVVETTIPNTDYIVQNLQDVSQAVVRISALGAVADTDNDEVGTGSGFFISNDGYILTNNHVVAGSQGIEVSTFENDIKIPAQIVGRSECKDLAVIKIEGNDYKYLTWYQEDIVPGLEVYAAGYPLSTEEYTLLDGIVSKKRADGENNWASVDEVVEHTANILPGSSGGPLVTMDGKVVAVNYAGIIEYGQSFAIASNLATSVTNTLLKGEDFLSIGINPEAFIDEEFEISGIFITAVEPNSIASKAGIIAGDILIDLDGNDVGIDGLMTSYCDQLESWDFQTPLPFTVFRLGTDEILEGELLGNPVESLNVPPIIDLEVCPTSLKIGETYEFNILFIEGTAKATSISVIFSDSTGNFEVDIDPQQFIEPIDIDGQTVYAGSVIKPVYFEGTKNKGVVRGSIIDRSGLSSNFECEIDLIIPVTITTTTVPKTNSTVAASDTTTTTQQSTATTQQTTTTTVASDTSRPYRSTSRLDINNVTTTSLTLSWDAFQDNVGVTEYQIYRSNTYIGSTSSTNYNVTGLTPGSYNSFSVYAFDAAGNQSSSYVNNWTYTASTTTTTIFVDSFGPSRSSSRLTVSNLTQTSLTLSWDAFTDNVGVVEYRVSNPYSPYTLYATTSNTSVDLTGLDTNSFYRFKVVAYDAAGNSSSSYVQTSTTTLNTTTTTSTTTTTTLPPFQYASIQSLTYSGSSIVSSDDTATFNLIIDRGSEYNIYAVELQVQCGSSIIYFYQDQYASNDYWYRNGDIITVKLDTDRLVTGSSTLSDLDPGCSALIYRVDFRGDRDDAGYKSLDNAQAGTVFTKADDPPILQSSLNIAGNTTEGFYVNWSAATNDSGPVSYELYANGVLNGTTSDTSYTYTGLNSGTDYLLKYCAVDSSSNKSCSSETSTYTRYIVNLPSITSFSITSPYSQGAGSTLSINYAVSFGGAKPGTAHPQFGGVDIFTWSDQVDGTRYDGFNSGSSSGTSGTINITSLTGYVRVSSLRVEILLPNTQRIYVLYYGDVREGSGDVDNKVICKSANALNPFGGSFSRYEFNCPGTIVTPYTGNNQSGTTNSFFSNSIVGEYFNP